MASPIMIITVIPRYNDDWCNKILSITIFFNNSTNSPHEETSPPLCIAPSTSISRLRDLHGSLTRLSKDLSEVLCEALDHSQLQKKAYHGISTPRPPSPCLEAQSNQKALGAWFVKESNHRLSQGTTSESLSRRFSHLDTTLTQPPPTTLN
jgi:hypothetical protein